MSTFTDLTLTLATQPVANLNYIPFAGIEPNTLLVDAAFGWAPTSRCLIVPELVADPAASPAAGSAFFFYKLAGGAWSLNIKTSGGAVKTVAVT